MLTDTGVYQPETGCHRWQACSHRDEVKPEILVVWRTAFASRLAPTEKQSSAAARGEAAPLNNERKLEYCF